MFLKPNSPNFYDISIANAFKIYKGEVLTLTKKMWKEEAIEGASCKQSYIMQYHAAIYLAVILLNIYKDGTTSWEELLKKYKIEDKKKKFACNGIDFDLILAAFGLPSTSECGIEGMGIEDTFEIEPADSPCNNTVEGECISGIEAMGIEENFEIEPSELNELCFFPEIINVQQVLANPCTCIVNIETVCDC